MFGDPGRPRGRAGSAFPLSTKLFLQGRNPPNIFPPLEQPS